MRRLLLRARNNISWPQATRDSTRNVGMRYRIRLFSSSLLLDPEGKVLLVNQRKMRGQDLLKSLDELLPP